MKEDFGKPIANTSAYPYLGNGSPSIRRPIALSYTGAGNLLNPAQHVVQYINSIPSTSNLHLANFSNAIPVNIPFPLEGIPQHDFPYAVQPYQSTAFFLPMTNYQPYPIQSMTDHNHSQMLSIEQGLKLASECSPGSYVFDQRRQLDSLNPPMFPEQIYPTIPQPKREGPGSVEVIIPVNGKSPAESNTSNSVKKVNSDFNSTLYDLKKMRIRGGTDEIMLKNNHAPNLIVTLNLRKDQEIEKDFAGKKLNTNSILMTLEKPIKKKLTNRKRRTTRCSQAARMAYKNQYVEAFRYRNVYKFVLKNLHSHIKDESIQIRRRMTDRKFSMDSIDNAFEYIQGLTTRESPNDSFKLSRSKLDILLSNPSTAFVLKESLASMLQKLINNGFPQILEKNKKTYKEACEVYLKKAEEKLDAWNKTLASNN